MYPKKTRFPPPISPVPGCRYTARMLPGNEKVEVGWNCPDRDTWKLILAAIKALPVRNYNTLTKLWELPWDDKTREWLFMSGWPAPDPPVEKANLPDPLEEQRAKIDRMGLIPGATLLPGLRPYQVDFLKFCQVRHGRVLLGDEMGCISGDMLVHIDTGEKVVGMSLETLHRKYSEDKKWKIKCVLADGTLGYGEIVDVIKSGIKGCVHVTLDNGKFLIATHDHRVLTEYGYVEAEKLLGCRVRIDGEEDYARVDSVYACGMRMTYDVKVLEHANFVANRIVVHNCGKTVEALAWMVYAQSFPALYVVNAPTKLQWKNAYEAWLSKVEGTFPKPEVLYGKTPHELSPDRTYIINWDILADWVGHTEKTEDGKSRFIADGPLTRLNLMLLVGDEVQAIGNPKSIRSMAFMAMAKITREVIAMSGTPAMSRPAQFWPCLNIMMPDVFPDYYKYLYTYCDPKNNGYGMTFNGVTNADQLHRAIVNCMLRRTKQDVMKDLPPKTIEVVPLETDPDAMKAYAEEEASIFGGGTELSGMRNRIAGLLHTAFTLKEKALEDWVDCFLQSGEKLLLFAWHRDVVDLLCSQMKPWKPAKIYGGMTAHEREEAKDMFIKDEDCRLLVANIQSGGVGIDGLQTVASHCAFAEFAHTPNFHRQAEDRLARSGQTKPVTAYYLVASGTIDMEAMEILDERAKMLDGLVDGKEAADIDLLTEIMERKGLRVPRL